MKNYIEEELKKVELEMIQHFADHNLEEIWDEIYLLEKDYFPKLDVYDDDGFFEEQEFIKWFYYYQGQYHKLQDILKYLNN